MNHRLSIVGLLCLGFVAGCGPQRTAPSVEAEALGVTPGVTFLTLERLQQGTQPRDESAATDFETTKTGLQYRVLREGSDTRPRPSSTVEVHYRGWTDNGTVFDESYRTGQTASFPLSGVIKGWTEGLQLVGKGGMIELWLPSDLAYGKTGGPGIPPNTHLHFIVELIDVK